MRDRGFELHLVSRKKCYTESFSKVHLLDLRDCKKAERLVSETKPEVLIHLAGSGFQYEKKETLEQMIETNFLATLNLTKACQKLNGFRKFVYLTTYMECQGSEKPIRADDMLVPQSGYALSKSISTNLLLYLSRTGALNSTVLRLFSVYGLNDRNFRFIPGLFDARMNNRTIETTSLRQKRDFIYIRDVADAIVKSVEVEKAHSILYNVGSGKATQLLDAARMIEKLTKGSRGEIKIGAKPDRPNEASCYFADISRTKRELGWKPKYSLEEGLHETYEFITAGGLG